MTGEDKRSFLHLLRSPDEDFSSQLRMLSLIAPIALGFLATVVFIAVVVARAVLGGGSPLALAIARLASPVMWFIIALILPVFFIFMILHVYVMFKIRKSQGR
jgi:hypothetical protein